MLVELLTVFTMECRLLGEATCVVDDPPPVFFWDYCPGVDIPADCTEPMNSGIAAVQWELENMIPEWPCPPGAWRPPTCSQEATDIWHDCACTALQQYMNAICNGTPGAFQALTDALAECTKEKHQYLNGCCTTEERPLP